MYCMTGLSGRIYSNRVAAADTIGIATGNSVAMAALMADCYAIATAIVAEITQNGEAVILPGTSGLQTTTNPGSPTGPNLIEITLPVR